MYGLVGCGWSSGATWCQNSLRLSASGALAGSGARPDEPFDHIWTYLALALSLKQPAGRGCSTWHDRLMAHCST